jgi:hypothetical protein
MLMRSRPATLRTPNVSSRKYPTTLLGETRDMINDRLLFLNINADPRATLKQKSFANDILPNEFIPGVADCGGSAKTHKYVKLYEH